MRSDFGRKKNESIPWTPVLRGLGFQEIALATDYEDRVLGFDMVARRYPQGPLIRFSLRSRPFNPSWLKEFTIRWKRPNGVRTEKDKILDGSAFPDLLLLWFHLGGWVEIKSMGDTEDS